MARPRLRSAHQYNVYSADTSIGWIVMRLISFAQGEDAVRAGRMRHVYTEQGKHAGYQLVEKPRVLQELPSLESSVNLTPAEMEAIAGTMGRSETAHLPQDHPDRFDRRHAKTGRRLPDEDFVERARKKFEAWRFMR